MARVPYVEDDALVEPAKSRVLNHPIALYRGLANAPGALECFAEIGQWIRWDSHVDPRHREMVILAVGVINASTYEFSHHVKIGRDFGLSDSDIIDTMTAARGEESVLTGTDALMIKAAREITVDGEISDESYEELAELYDHQTLVELVLIIAHYSTVTRVVRSLRIDVEPDYQPYLDEFPLTN